MEQEIFKFFIQALAQVISVASKPGNKDMIELLKTLITAASSIIAAIIIGIAGAYVTYKYNKERDKQQRDAESERHTNQIEAENTRHANQIIAENRKHFNQLIASSQQHQQDIELVKKRHDLDKETEWRSHAIELTKLDMQRKLATRKEDAPPVRPSILDFLANYRDLKELDTKTPAELYTIIETKRIKSSEKQLNSEPPQL